MPSPLLVLHLFQLKKVFLFVRKETYGEQIQAVTR